MRQRLQQVRRLVGLSKQVGRVDPARPAVVFAGFRRRSRAVAIVCLAVRQFGVLLFCLFLEVDFLFYDGNPRLGASVIEVGARRARHADAADQ